MKKTAFFCFLSLVVSIPLFGIDMSFVGTPGKKLEYIFDIDNQGLLTDFSVPIKTGKIRFGPRTTNLNVKRLKFYPAYRTTFGEVELKDAGKGAQNLVSFRYPAEGFSHLGTDSKGNIWSFGKGSQKKIGVFAQREVIDLNGDKRTLKMHRLHNASYWSCALNGKILVDKGDGKLQTVGYVSWFNLSVNGGGRVLLPMTSRIGFPVTWTGRFEKGIFKANQDDIEKLVQAAIRKNDLEALKVYLKHDPEILKKTESKHNRSLLLQVLRNAYNNEKYRLIKFLANNGCQVNKSDHNGVYPIHQALELQDVSLTELFLQKGADPNQTRMKTKTTPLHLAAQGRVYNIKNQWVRKSNPFLVDMLLKKGASVDALDANQRTPLHYAARYLNLFAAEKLLKAGANVNAQDNQGDTPGIKAVKGWDWEFEMCHNNCQNRTREKVTFRNWDMVKLLEHYGLDKKILNNKEEYYPSIYLNDELYNVDQLPGHLKSQKTSLAKYTKFWKMKYLVADSSYRDMVAAFGEPHKFLNKTCFVNGKVYDCSISWYWSDKTYHKFIFKSLSLYTPSKKMTLNIAGYGGENHQVIIDNPNTKTKLIGGKLINFNMGGYNYKPLEFARDIDIQSLKLFESGKEFIKKENRDYTTKFKNQTTRYINWELNLSHPADKYKKYFMINIDFYLNGKLSESTEKFSFIKKGLTSSYHSSSWGTVDPGSWDKGRYKMVLSVVGKRIAETEFQVE